MAVDSQFIRDVSDALDALGAASLENNAGAPRGADVILDMDQVEQVLSLPGVKYSRPVVDADGEVDDKAKAQEYVQIPYSILTKPLQGAEKCNVTLSEDGKTLTVTNRLGVEKTANVQGEKGDTGEGFSIFRTYVSVSAMNADAANVPEGKFVLIASDVEDADNAKLYSKNSQGSFTFLTDMSGAQGIKGDPFTYDDFTPAQIADLKKPATDAAAEWTDIYKPQVARDHNTAQDDHTQASNDHTQASNDHTQAAGDHNTAQDDHTQASNDHTQASNDHTQAAGDHTTAGTDHTQSAEQTALMEAWNTHLPYIGDGTTGDENYWYIYDPTSSQYVKGPYAKGDDLRWDDMSEEDKESLAERVLEALVFASVETCESIIDELI